MQSSEINAVVAKVVQKGYVAGVSKISGTVTTWYGKVSISFFCSMTLINGNSEFFDEALSVMKESLRIGS